MAKEVKETKEEKQKVYVVKKGDSLFTIAQESLGECTNEQAYVKMRKIIDDNQLTTDFLHVGQKLVI